MKKIYSILSVLVCVLAVPTLLHAAGKKTVAIVLSSSIGPYQQARDGFKTYFDEQGFALAVSEHTLEAQNAADVRREIAEKKPDAILALGTKAAKLAQENWKDIPVVFCMVMDPTPILGPNVTGVLMEVPVDTKLKTIAKLIPAAKKIGMFYSSGSVAQYEEMSRTCQEEGFRLYARKIDSESEIPDAIGEISGAIDCFVMTPDPRIFFPKSIEHLLLEGLRNKFAIMGLSSFYTKAGTLLSLECDYRSMGKQAADMMMGLFGGEKCQDMPPRSPLGTSLSLNVLVAKRLNIVLPPEVLKEAREIYGEGE